MLHNTCGWACRTWECNRSCTYELRLHATMVVIPYGFAVLELGLSCCVTGVRPATLPPQFF
jgi:hypothetical protein